MKKLLLLLSPLLATLTHAQPAWMAKYDSTKAGGPDGIAIVYKNGKAGYAEEKTGKELSPPKYDFASPFKEGVAVVGKKVTYDSYQKGLLNRAGKEIVPLVYDYISDMEDGIAICQLKEKYGYLDKSGKKITPVKYDIAGKFKGGMAKVSLYDRNKGETKWGLINRTGKEIVPPRYTRIYANAGDAAVVEKEKDNYFIVSNTGKETPLPYDKIGYENYGLLLVQSGKKFGFINAKGEVVIPLKYDNAWDFSTYSSAGHLSSVRLDGKCGFIDTTGKDVIPIQYDGANLFREGLAAVKKKGPKGMAADDQWGFVDSTGALVIPMKYNAAGYFSEGLAHVSQPKGSSYYNYGYIDRSGKLIIPFEYESADEFSEGLAAVKKGGKWGFIDKEGKLIISYKYEMVISGFSNKRAKVVLNRKTMTLDKTGKEY